MIEHRNSGALGGGKSAEGLGSTTGSGGEVRKSVQDLYGHAAGASQKTMDKIAPDSLDDVIRRYIETKPYTTALIALGVGWLMGRSHHPF
ncbi:MAG TPA: hypothetical protein VGG86_03950 [Roseiarcus sp.]